MKTFVLTLGGIAVLGVLGYLIYANTTAPRTQPESAMMEEDTNGTFPSDETMMEGEKADDTMMGDELKDDAMMEESTGGAKQINFTNESSAQAYAKTGRSLLFFKASWCPTCKAAQEDLDANLSKLPSDLTIVTVDYDTSGDLKKKYGVTYQHTWVQIDENGNEITKWNGGGVDTINNNLVADN